MSREDVRVHPAALALPATVRTVNTSSATTDRNSPEVGPETLSPREAFRAASPWFGAMLCPGAVVEGVKMPEQALSEVERNYVAAHGAVLDRMGKLREAVESRSPDLGVIEHLHVYRMHAVARKLDEAIRQMELMPCGFSQD